MYIGTFYGILNFIYKEYLKIKANTLKDLSAYQFSSYKVELLDKGIVENHLFLHLNVFYRNHKPLVLHAFDYTVHHNDTHRKPY